MAVFICILAITLISDFTSVLIDVRDNAIILPRPVNDRTFSASRILHIGLHVSKLAMAFALPGLVMSFFIDGWGALLLIPEILLGTLFAIFTVNVVYLAVLRYTTPEKFNNVISYVQIAFSVVIFAGYQLLPRLAARVDLAAIDPLRIPWSWALPPVWFASFYSVFARPETFSPLLGLLALAGFFAPVLAIVYVMKVLAPGFNRKLSAIPANGDAETRPQPAAQKRQAGVSLADRLSRLVSSNKVEQAGFRLTWLLTSRYRDFRMKVYPSFAYVPIYVAYFFFLRPGEGGPTQGLDDFRKGYSYFFVLYFASFIILTVLQQVPQSEKYKAAWVMFTTAHNAPGRILSGMFQAVVVKFFVPYFLMIAVAVTIVCGPRVIDDVILALLNSLCFGLLVASFTVRYLPFSEPVTVKGGRFFAMFFVFLAIGVIGLLHFFLSKFEWGVPAAIPVTAGIFWVMLSYFRNRDWKALEADYG